MQSGTVLTLCFYYQKLWMVPREPVHAVLFLVALVHLFCSHRQNNQIRTGPYNLQFVK